MEKHTKPVETERMPLGIPHIIGNEAAERFSFYGMKAILAVFFVEYLHLMDAQIGKPMDETRAAELVHLFNGAFYLTPILGAILADVFLGKYKVIIGLSLLYCAGHAALALMGQFGNSDGWMISGLVMIALGAGGIKPCVSAHVGDQFGARNSHLLPRVFDWFYFSINLGAFVSMLLTPWLLEWYGPHWAFGVPGILMAIATLIFWLGRNRFAHVPAGGLGFLKEVFSKDGLLAMLKLAPLYLFVAMFWALFDQSGSTWIFQSEDMDRHFLGFEWLPSQIQTLNSVFVLSFIPIFSLIIYPWGGRFCPLSPLRKMGAGFFLMSAAFVIISLIQVRIDAGERPHIIWQIAAFALLTASEILVSIVALEFAYTQAPRKMKSFIMCFYLAAVALGNFLVAGVNHFIRIPSAAEEQLALALANLPEDWQKDPRTVVLPGFDPRNPAEAYIRRLDTKHGPELEVPGQVLLDRAAKIIISAAEAGGSLPDEEAGKKRLSQSKDLWGRQLRYVTLNSSTVRIWSAGADAQWNTKWDIGIIISKSEPALVTKALWLNSLRPQESWLETRKRELGLASSAAEQGSRYSQSTFSGGQTRLQGAAYFWFFSSLMLVTSILFVPLAIWFRPKSYLQDS
jgi:POT family proton-dependent oligopeptide transporter